MKLVRDQKNKESYNKLKDARDTLRLISSKVLSLGKKDPLSSLKELDNELQNAENQMTNVENSKAFITK
jgi:hypothetical protein